MVAYHAIVKAVERMSRSQLVQRKGFGVPTLHITSASGLEGCSISASKDVPTNLTPSALKPSGLLL